jgi:3-hydroxyisobutyrate dehydrogenase-like beta-hydroxyacid dehydrogenase
MSHLNRPGQLAQVRQTSESPQVIAVLGLGEAGSEIAAGLCAAGAVVQGFDPRIPAGPGIIQRSGDADASRNAGVTIALTSAHEAEQTLLQALPGLQPGSVYADLNTSSSALKRTLAAIAADAGVVFADVALMSPVPGNGLQTPMLTSGPGAAEYARIFGGLGASVELLPGPPGLAADRKLVRSVFYKGLAAAVIEALRAAQVVGCEEWLRENIRSELMNADAQTIDRLIHGSRRHARRRADEMSAASDLLDELGVPNRVARASQQWLTQLLGEQG